MNNESRLRLKVLGMTYKAESAAYAKTMDMANDITQQLDVREARLNAASERLTRSLNAHSAVMLEAARSRALTLGKAKCGRCGRDLLWRLDHRCGVAFDGSRVEVVCRECKAEMVALWKKR